jgi:hypothetical protein
MIAGIASPLDLLSEPRRKPRKKPGKNPRKNSGEDNKDSPPA